MKPSIRHANIGIAVGATILIAGVLAFRNSSEGVLQAIALVSMFCALAVAQGLDERERRRKRRRSQ